MNLFNFLVMIIVAFIISSTVVFSWKIDRKPRIYGDKVPQKIISTHLRRVQRRIVTLHDFFRSRVIPSPSNMLKMQWNNGAAQKAQKWANQCQYLQHDSALSRSVGTFGACGQNIFVSTHKVPWLFALKTWFIERQNFTYGSTKNNLFVVGHYTQMVWAATHKVGCGLSKCESGGPNGKPFYNYVCDYCPIGNYQNNLGFPYKAGNFCSSCPYECNSDRRLCTNACNAADQWDNCQQLYTRWSGWLCNSVSPEGYNRRKSCLATCTCKGKIYD